MAAYTQFTKKIQQYQEHIKQIDDIVKILVSFLQKQAKHSLIIRDFYKKQKFKHVKDIQHIFNQKELLECNEYSGLINQQFIPKIKSIREQLLKIKDQLGKVNFQLKKAVKEDKQGTNKNAQNQISKAIQKIGKKIQTERNSFERSISNQTKLMCNYRMDITARQIQTWSIGVDQKISKESISLQIEKIFKEK